MLVELFQDMAEDMEDCRAATVLTAIDFAKAFNRLSYQLVSVLLRNMGPARM